MIYALVLSMSLAFTPECGCSYGGICRCTVDCQCAGHVKTQTEPLDMDRIVNQARAAYLVNQAINNQTPKMIIAPVPTMARMINNQSC